MPFVTDNISADHKSELISQLQNALHVRDTQIATLTQWIYYTL